MKLGEVVIVDFPGAMGVKRRPAVFFSSEARHSTRPEVILGLITNRVAAAIGSTDYVFGDWVIAGLRLPSLFPSFLVTVALTAVHQVAGHLSDKDWLAVRATIGTALAHR